MNNRYKCVVDLDLEKIFDTVNQDLLISIIRKTVNEDAEKLFNYELKNKR